MCIRDRARNSFGVGFPGPSSRRRAAPARASGCRRGLGARCARRRLDLRSCEGVSPSPLSPLSPPPRSRRRPCGPPGWVDQHPPVAPPPPARTDLGRLGGGGQGVSRRPSCGSGRSSGLPSVSLGCLPWSRPGDGDRSEPGGEARGWRDRPGCGHVWGSRASDAIFSPFSEARCGGGSRAVGPGATRGWAGRPFGRPAPVAIPGEAASAARGPPPPLARAGVGDGGRHGAVLRAAGDGLRTVPASGEL